MLATSFEPEVWTGYQTEWPDEFYWKWPKIWPNPFLWKKRNVYRGQKLSKNLGNVCNFILVNNHPTVENSTNLVPA
jgi:hypothetical protein